MRNLLFVLLIAAVTVSGDGYSAEGDTPAGAATPAPQKKNKYQKSKLTSDESEALADKRRLLLSTGEDRAVDIDFEPAGANGITIGNPGVVAFTLVKLGEKRQVVFKPLKSGDTTVLVRDNEGTIRLIFKIKVTGSNLLRVANEIRDLMRDVEGLTIRVVGPKVVIEGEVLVPSDYGRLLTVITDKAYADVILNMTTLSNVALVFLAKKIQEDVNVIAPNVKSRVVNGIILMEGTVDNGDQAKRAMDLAYIYMPEIKPGSILNEAKDPTARALPPRPPLKNFIVVNPPPPRKQEKLVRVTVHFVELKKDYNKVFGFKWEPGFTTSPTYTVGTGTAGGATAAGNNGLTATISELLPKLQSAQKAGYARILKTGTVIVRSGQPATLKEETQVGFLLIGQNGQTTSDTVGVGLNVAVTPQILGQSEDIAMDLNMTQSNVVSRAPANQGKPITATHNVVTKLYVKSNESAAVAGVTSSTISTNFNKDDPRTASPETGSGTQALFSLIHSKAYQKEKSQFVIFVTPQIVENASEGTDDLKKNFRVKVK